MSFEVKKNSPVAIRFKRVLVVGMIVGGIIGCLITAVICSSFWKKQNNQIVQELDKKNTENVQSVKEKEDSNAQLAETEKQLNDEKTLHEEMSHPAELLASDKENWNTALVNSVHPLAKDYSPKMKKLVDDKYVDERIYDEATKMLADAKKAGVSVNVCSAYRSYSDQKDVFQETMNQWIADGYDTMDAFYETSKSVALPGQSEHATGLALDITSAEYMELDERQATTDTAKWLQANCANYGFILRYPPEKSDITKIIYEPWHYRYVGKELAQEIMSEGITLEEYWENKFK